MKYSVVIRTLGTAGEKYACLLQSIKNQTIQPEEVIVVLPEKYSLPLERLGWERFVYSQKGMISQRVKGLLEAKTDYCLFLDDDLELAPDLVKQLFEPIDKGVADVTFPIMLEMLPTGFFIKFFSAISGSAVPSLRKTNFYTKILRTSGWIYNDKVSKKEKYYSAECAPGACFLTSKHAFLNIKFEDEIWLERTIYSIPEDQVNFYKFHIMGYRILGISDISIKHLDAGSKSSDRRFNNIYALARNRIIFWHRFIFLTDKYFFSKFLSFICILYFFLISTSILLCSSILKRDFKSPWMQLKGLWDGIKFIHSDDYKKIPLIQKTEKRSINKS